MVGGEEASWTDAPPPTTHTLSLPAPHHPHLMHDNLFIHHWGKKTGTALRASGPGTTNCFLPLFAESTEEERRSAPVLLQVAFLCSSARRSFFLCCCHTTTGNVLLERRGSKIIDSWPPPKRLHCFSCRSKAWLHHSSSPHSQRHRHKNLLPPSQSHASAPRATCGAPTPPQQHWDDAGRQHLEAAAAAATTIWC